MVVVALAFFALAMVFIHHDLRNISYDALIAGLKAIPAPAIIFAVAATIMSFVAVSLSENLTLKYAQQTLPLRRTAVVSASAYAVSNALGFSALTGNAVRQRLYTSWGLSTLDIAVVTLVAGAFVLMGGLTVTAAALLIDAPLIAATFHVPAFAAYGLAIAVIIGVIVAAASAAYGPDTRLVRGITIQRPSRGVMALQWIAAGAEWIASIAVLYVLLPSSADLSFFTLVPLFVAARYLGALSGLPGGIGVFEAVILTLVPGGTIVQVAAALIAYRALYFVLPLLLTILAVAMRQGVRSRKSIAARGAAAGDFAEALAPTLYALVSFLTGATMLVSAATPEFAAYFGVIAQYLPPALIEVSHLVASGVGTLLLITAIGLRRRLHNAWRVAIALFVMGAVFTVMKGGDPKGSLLMIILALCLFASRDAFYRKGHLAQVRLTLGRMGAILGVASFALWSGFYAFRNKAYSQELWWQFGLQDDASRFLRAAALVGAILLIFFIWRLIQPAPRPNRPESSDAVLAQAKAAMAGADNCVAESNLALIGDKSFLFSPSGQSFIMYGVKGRNWIAMGEPIGLESERRELMWAFRQLADNWDAWPSFYAIRGDNLPDFVDLGLTVQKIGELALIPITDFTLDGPEKSKRRQARARAIRDGCSFEIIYPAIGSAEMDALQAISDRWMSDHQGREKRFSLGFFDAALLDGRPVATVRKDGGIIAFANLWDTPDKSELSLDLMRFIDAGVNGVMDYLTTEILLWGAEQGYGHFSLGMAPLSGIDGHRLAPLMSRLGRLVYKYGGRIYSFAGLRAYKEKFKPDWTPVYLAAPSQMAMPQALGNLALLSSGGVLGLIQRGD